MSVHCATDLLFNSHIVAVINERITIIRNTTAKFFAQTLKAIGPLKDRECRPSLSNFATGDAQSMT
jgi:hypothetical protein